MAVFHGKTAKVDLGGAIEATTGWSMTTTADTAESTYMGLTWQGFEVGLDDATATVDGNGRTERATVGQIGSEASLKLYIDATNYFYFNAICTSLTESVDKDGVGAISYGFEMDDASGVQYG